ncbi:efflux RND transporter periplasmic adaptor subunit [Echinicola soli]|uniref:Efflux RND transporter periplasmic adaptor subunit n=1 Tax=Echinicola soli TaxID=2591634 RepID=A0A514CKW6_9BACT|nr:efflux RND transporter periplasmic adaptor subunit [Echinicola soli]QDH80324.1 efflux RND transporter periplasmic adaptor subunit [Echinicola soli]
MNNTHISQTKSNQALYTLRWIVGAVAMITLLSITACNDEEKITDHSDEEEKHEEGLHLSNQQVEALQLTIDTVSTRAMARLVEVNGVLEVPPQNEAAVTAYIGANVVEINVIEGDKIQKGQALAHLSHPQLIKIQSDYSQSWHEMDYLQKEYNRQNTLYEEEVGSGRDMQKTAAELASLGASISGQESQLRLLGLDPTSIRKGVITDRIPVKSPISGYIKEVHIKTGQYVGPEYEMFEVVNIHHIHADMMVFEKDVSKVKVGQKVRFSVETLPGEELMAEVYSVGKSFESKPKAVHIHAEIENKKGLLIPGMYVRGQVITDKTKQPAVPEEAIAKEGDRNYLFSVKKQGEEWLFEKTEIVLDNQNDGWVSVKFMSPEDANKKYVMNKAYYLVAETKKGEGGHHH